MLSGSHLQGRWGWAPLPRQRQILGVRGAQEVPTLPPYSLTWIFTMNFPLQLCGGTWRLSLATRDRIRTKGMAWIREEAANQASSECAVPPVLACVGMPMNTSSHSSVHTLPVCVCVHTCPMSIDLHVNLAHL